MQAPLVSIIIPTYNRAHLIGETLDSILAQTYTNWECIVVDDGSMDNTNDVLESYCKKDTRLKYYQRPKSSPKGANTCRNYGFELSKGEYINWFDSDDLMLVNFIKNKVESFNNSIDLVICTGYEVDNSLGNRIQIELNETSNLFKDYVLWKLHVLTPSILFRRSFLYNKELFSNKITRGQESELFSRLFFGIKIESYKIINSPLFLYRQHENSKTYKNKTYIKSYKESQTFIALENFKKSIIINDHDLINYFYENLISLFFRGLENRHQNNSKLILKNLIYSIYPLNKTLSIKLMVLGNFFLIFNRGSYNFEKKIKTTKLV